MQTNKLYFFGKNEIETKLNEIIFDLFRSYEIYNPWSVINYVDNDCNPQAFWLSTSSNDIINEILNNADNKLKEDLYTLLVGNKITTYIDTNIIYPEINHNLSVIYSFLLVSGYLKIDKKYAQVDGNFMCDIKIPNKEISLVYKNDIIKKLRNENTAIDFQIAIFQKNINKLQKALEKLMIETISSFDTANEAFYHGMLLRILSIVSSKYRILSNLESGLGRFDIELIPLSKDIPAFIFEIKNTKDVKEIDALSTKALNQIEEKKYDIDLKANGIENIIKIGIAFCVKEISLKSNNNL